MQTSRCSIHRPSRVHIIVIHHDGGGGQNARALREHPLLHVRDVVEYAAADQRRVERLDQNHVRLARQLLVRLRRVALGV